jgi:hypothetical protein
LIGTTLGTISRVSILQFTPAGLVLEFDTPFHAAVRNLKSPTSASFDAAEWLAAFDQLKDPQRLDTSLLVAAVWIAAESMALRDLPKDPDFEALDAATTVMLAVATMNREYLTAEELSGESIKAAHEKGAVSFGHILLRPLREASTRQSISADDAIQAAVDAGESWIFDGYRKAGGTARDDLDLARVAARAMRRYSIQRGLNDLWNQSYWEGWRLTNLGDKFTWAPSNRSLATRLRAGLIRQSENFMNYPFIDMAAWVAMDPEARRARALPRTVVGISSGHRRKIRVGRPTCRSRKPPAFLVERGGLEGSYLEFLLDRPFPNEERFTCRRLVQAWHVILDLALALSISPRSEGGWPRKAAEKMALIISRPQLVRILSEAMAVDASTADAAVAFLTFKPKTGPVKGHRGLWSAPIVSVPGGDDVALVLPVLASSNPLRKAEAWLEKGGLDDSLSKGARGDLYESEYRRKIREAIARNNTLKEAVCAEREIKKDTDFGEQIDLLIRLGPLLIVGEVKCWLFPADPIERFYHLRKLKEAAEQAKRKANMLRARPDVAAKSLGLSEGLCRQLRVTPLVIANQGFGFSLNFDGCIVADAAFLKTYLANGTLSDSMAIDWRTGAMIPTAATLYEREHQAGEWFEKEFSNPLVLRRFENRIAWTTVPFPSLVGDDVHFAAPRLDDLSGDERVRAEVMVGAMSRA